MQFALLNEINSKGILEGDLQHYKWNKIAGVEIHLQCPPRKKQMIDS